MDFKTYLYQNYTDEFASALLNSFSQKSTNACLLNIDKISDEQFLSFFPDASPHPLVKHAFLYDKEEYALGKHWLHDAGAFYLQDPSAMVVASLLEFNSSDRVLDLCAAPGGKAIQTSLMMKNEGLIIANDLSYTRALVLSQNVERMGRKNIIVTASDFQNIADKYQNYFTKIILDAPCSGSGMFRKDKKMADDWSYAKVLKCQEAQKELILLAFSLLAPGGSLIYSTCSYSIEENEDVIAFLQAKTDAETIYINAPDTIYRPKKLPQSLLLTSSTFCGEGQFICLLAKPGTVKKDNVPYINNSRSEEKLLTQLSLSGQIWIQNKEYYLMPFAVDMKYLKVIRPGLKLGKYIKQDFIPDYHLSHFYSSQGSIKLTSDQARHYLAGESIKLNYMEGFYLVSYHAINLGYVKSVQGVLKNHYPKGLRLK